MDIRISAAAGLTALAVAVSACGNGGGSHAASTPSTSTSTSTTSTAPSRHDLAQTYLRIVRPGNAAVDRFNTAASHWNNDTTGAQAAKDAAPLVAAIREADRQLLRVQWSPSSTRDDVKELVRAHGALIGDLSALESLDVFSAGNWVNQFTHDAGSASAAGGIVRADLGLPASKP